ncbi:hypothetical protein [Pectobacterium carotovorum]|uniref:hypothetical protein n=1 Tax=Pectobacterium carotovorum TaxID=554 RepID=UPI001CF56146|nr:hypothetical protein [Pectobacterium carotovorum]MCA6974738.1 hypothetical protein [Pectobacterium carotovorum]
MNKSSTISIFLIPTFIWLSLAFAYAFFCGDRDVDTYFFNSWDFAAWIIFAIYTIICSIASIFLRLIMKKYFIVTIAILIFLFIIKFTNFGDAGSFLFFLTMLTIPLFGSLTLRHLHKKQAHHQRTGNQENEN